jgi:hypothetical protein
LANRIETKTYRTDHKLKDVLRQEQDLRLEFRRRGSQLIGEGKPADHWERYFLMQHYGVPTRLLDWTDGALVALYFAVKQIRIPEDAVVYILDPWWLCNLVYKELPIAKVDRPLGTAMPEWNEAKPHGPMLKRIGSTDESMAVLKCWRRANRTARHSQLSIPLPSRSSARSKTTALSLNRPF